MEDDLFIGQIFSQNCGDELKVLKKSDKKQGTAYLWECQFLKYPYKVFVSKQKILKKTVVNPEIENQEFIGKKFPQNCGDILRVIEKSNLKKDKNILFKCEFLKYPYIIYCRKDKILSGSVNNPEIENQTFIGKEFLQNCGDSLIVLEKTNKYINTSVLYKCQFQKYPCIVYSQKIHIKNGIVENKNSPWKNKNSLIKYIQENFKEKPTLQELADSLNIGYTTIGHKINEFGLREYIQYYPDLQEDSLRNYINTLIKTEIFNDNKYEIDVFCKDKNLGFEYNGNYWHSELYKSQNYHQEKSIYFKEKNIQLIHIWEWEWLEKENLIKSFIKSKLGILNKKIGASKCKVKEIKTNEYKDFCNENHLQGKADAKVKLGLFYKNELIQVMSFSKPRFTNDFDWEIIRECSKQGYIILGGKEKLWKYFVKNFYPKNCISYCDFSKFTGNSYLKLGFKKERLNKPGFVWYDNKTNQIFQRSPWKHKEMKEKYIRIFDAGQLVFIWNKENS